MALKVTIFEDNKDLADAMKDDMERKGFEVSCIYNLDSKEWMKSDVILADFRNEIVKFSSLKEICKKKSIPIIAISGAETGFRPQVLKPFTVEQLQSAILSAMMASSKSKRIGGTSPLDFIKKLFGISKK